MHIICLFVASIKDAGKKFQLANVKDVNYRTESSGNVRFGASDVAITACVKLTFSAWVNKHDGTLAAVIGKLLAWHEVVTEFCKATNIADASCTQSI